MICICRQRQLELLTRFGNLPANAGSGLVLPANLMPAVGALGGSLANANAALAAAPLAANANAAPAAVSPQASAAATLAANPQLAAAAQLSALAGGAAGMKASLGIDMSSPSAGAACADTWSMLPGLLQTLAALPLHLEPKLASLAKVGELSDQLKDELDVDLASPGWAEALNDSVADKLADAAQQAKDAQGAVQSALTDAADGASGLVPPVPPLTPASLAAEESANATTSLMAGTTSSVQVGLGIDLAAPGALDVLAKKLGALKGTLSSMPGAAGPLDMGLIVSAMQMLATIDTLKRTLGVDVLAPGAGQSLQSVVNSLASNLAAAPGACAALDGAASSAASLSLSGSGGAPLSGGASLGGSGSGSGGASLGGSSSTSASIASGASAASNAALAGSALADPALAQMMAGMPGVPVPWLLLTALCAQVKSTLGIQLIAHGPCK